MAKDFNLEDTVINLKLSRKELIHLTRILEASVNGVDDDGLVQYFIKNFNDILEESKNQFEVLTDVEKEHENKYVTSTEDVVVERIKKEYPHTMSIFK